ncbi:MAG: glycosyltransferase family 39 protein [Candidatus Kapaibacterium sp.]|jgi:hypothetical protein
MTASNFETIHIDKSSLESDATPYSSRTILLFVLGISAVIYFPSLFWSFGHDQNVFAEIGSLILKGKKPYLDAWDIKPPNIYYLYAIAEWIFGEHELSIRLLDYVSTLTSVVLIFKFIEVRLRVSSYLHPQRTAALGSFLLVIVALSLGLADTAQTESLSLPFLFGALVLASSEKRWLRGMLSANILAGCLIGFATFLKTTNAIFLLPIVLDIILGKRYRAGIDLLIGFVLLCALELGFMWQQGYLSAYQLIFNRVLTQHASEGREHTVNIFDCLRTFWTYLDTWTVLAIIGFALTLLSSKSKGLVRAYGNFLLLMLSLLIVACIAILIQKKGWGYHFIILLPGLVPIVAMGCMLLWKWLMIRLDIESSKSRKWLAVGVLGLLTLASPSGARRYRGTVDSILSVRHHRAYLAKLGSPQTLYFPPCTEMLADYVVQHVPPTESIFILGHEPGVYWGANRLPASKFIYTLLFTSPVMEPRDFVQLHQELLNASPKEIIIERYDTVAISGTPVTSESLLQTPPLAPIRELLRASYTQSDTVCGKFLIYTRKD